MTSPIVNPKLLKNFTTSALLCFSGSMLLVFLLQKNFDNFVNSHQPFKKGKKPKQLRGSPKELSTYQHFLCAKYKFLKAFFPVGGPSHAWLCQKKIEKNGGRSKCTTPEAPNCWPFNETGSAFQLNSKQVYYAPHTHKSTQVHMFPP